MSRRTKREKVNAKHSFQISWNGHKNDTSKSPVKRQREKSAIIEANNKPNNKSAKKLVKDDGFDLIRKDLVKSLGMFVVIVSLELVLYFILL